jgi:hypothetical protein
VDTFESCAVCGRTILAGERPRTYLTPEGERRLVCELCRDRAEQIGWVWEELIGQEPPAAPRRRRGPGLGAFFRGREQRARGESEEPAPEEPAPEQTPEEVPAGDVPPPAPDETEAEPAPQPVTEAAAPRNPDPAAPGARVGRAAAVPDSPKSRLQRAIDRFNTSEESHTVSGLMRTLGPPWVSVGSSSGAPSEVRITVAWELSWYQWGVDLKDELRPVYQLDKGQEVRELDGPAQQWNARAAEDGRLRLGTAGEHRG